MLAFVRRHTGQSRLVRTFFLLGVVQLLLAAFAGPFLLFGKHTVAAGMIYYLLNHGTTSQAFYFLGFPLALNARWLGVFFGLLCGLLIYQYHTQALSRLSPKRSALLGQIGLPFALLIIIPFAVDCFAGYLDHILSAGYIFLLGYSFGLAIPLCLVTLARRFFATSHRLRS